MEEVLIIGGIGVAGLLILAPVVGLLNPQVGKAMTDSGRNLAKTGIKFGIDASEKIQRSIAEAGQSWEDLVAEAKSEKELDKNSNNSPQTVEITNS
ncbi:hypothetical protein PCC7424_0218 [Gloeothece citriformis PCC 7424]|uniref:DUF5132 domain-containing protein n=1 Tax=Gloeothece citriformis (strain PCC 7424) TaxID=65393 RepID=B7KAL4_GLOC7|nr:DUF5132 domain-containing protein [Gloeothece citriformis]ACK68686.1 hypothetical protein PCC7424_0218 [Gloeothece citriformis PCC 7424]